MSSSQRPVAVVTGGTRGIGSGIAAALAEAGYDLLLTYNTNRDAALSFSQQLSAATSCRIECVGGDISQVETRDKIFECLDKEFPADCLHILVHNAGQYVGITSENSDGLSSQALVFGDGSMLETDESTGKQATKFDMMHYYQRMYGEAFVDLCERSLIRMKQRNKGGTIVGISSPGVTAALYGPNLSYSMPGSGKCMMEYASRIYARQAAAHDITVNVIVPGLVQTEAWERLAQSLGMEDRGAAMMQGILQRAPVKHFLVPRDIGNVVSFLSSSSGRFITGTVIPCDGGLHLTS